MWCTSIWPVICLYFTQLYSKSFHEISNLGRGHFCPFSHKRISEVRPGSQFKFIPMVGFKVFESPELCAGQSGEASKFEAHFSLTFLPFGDLRVVFIPLQISHVAFWSATSSCDYNTTKCWPPNTQPQTRSCRHPSSFPCSRRLAGAALFPCHCLTPFNITGVSAAPPLWDPGLIHACHVLYGMFILSLMCNSCVKSVWHRKGVWAALCHVMCVTLDRVPESD